MRGRSYIWARTAHSRVCFEGSATLTPLKGALSGAASTPFTRRRGHWRVEHLS